MQDTTQTISPAQASDSQHVAMADTSFHRPARHIVPLKADTAEKVSADSGIRYSTLNDSTLSGASIHLVTSPVAPPRQAVKYINLYNGHALVPIHKDPVKRQDSSPDWLFPVLLFVFAILTWLRIFYSKYFSQMTQALLNNNLTNQIVRDENILVQRASIFLSIAFNLIGALFLYLVSIHYGWEVGGIGTGFQRFIFYAIIVSAIYVLKFLVLKISGWLFNLDREMATYIFNIFLINNLVGLALLPIIALLAYNQVLSVSVLVILSTVIISAGLVYRVFRGLMISFSVSGFSVPYLILFLATFELAPLMFVLRLIL